jgi:AICAR transformylase/IMP cyclohydrolase PurH
MILPAEDSPVRVVNGNPGYINALDALGAWQLVRELKQATGKASAASFKHTSPAGAAVARPLSEAFRRSQFLPEGDLSDVAQAYVRARGGDRMSSFGDAAAVSEPVDTDLARILRREVSDLIIAPGYEPEALEILTAKKNGGYLILEVDAGYEPPRIERRELFGVTLEQERNTRPIDAHLFSRRVGKSKDVSEEVVETLIVASVALKYTQSNSVCVASDGQVIGMGAGQQSRVHCTRLACGKADKWMLQQHPRVVGLPFRKGVSRIDRTNTVDAFLLWDELSEAEKRLVGQALAETPRPLTPEERADWIGTFADVCLVSDAFFPFRDSLDRASRSAVRYVAQPGESARDAVVTEAADEYGMVMIHTGLRLFLH